MILSTEEIEKRLSSERNLIGRLKQLSSQSSQDSPSKNNPPEIVKSTKQTRLEGDTAKIPDCVRDLIAITRATSDESNEEIANSFHTSSNTVSLMKRGLVGYRKDERVEAIVDAGREMRKARNNERDERINEKSESAHELALDSLVDTLNAMKENLKYVVNPVKLAGIASQLSKVANDRQKKQEEAVEANRPKIILFAPSIKQENFYESIEA